MPFSKSPGVRRLACGIALAALLAGCTVWRPLSRPGGSDEFAVPEFYRHYYDYPAAAPSAAVLGEERRPDYVLRKVEIPLSLPESLLPSDLEAFRKKVEEISRTDLKTARDLKLRYTNRIDYYLPKNLKPGQKRPAILISPILGGNMVVDHFARYYTGRGYVAAIVYRKRVQWEPERGDIGQIEDYMRVSVIRLRQALDWLEKQPEVDANRIGAFGVSYGAILHTVLAAIEPRIRYHILCMPGGPLAEVIVDCPDPAIRKMMREVNERYGWSREKVYRDLKETIRTDPVYLAPYVPRDRVLMYVALFDRVVGARRTFALWKELGRPRLRILPFGHYGGIFVFPFLQTQSYAAFKRHLS